MIELLPWRRSLLHREGGGACQARVFERAVTSIRVLDIGPRQPSVGAQYRIFRSGPATAPSEQGSQVYLQSGRPEHRLWTADTHNTIVAGAEGRRDASTHDLGPGPLIREADHQPSRSGCGANIQGRPGERQGVGFPSASCRSLVPAPGLEPGTSRSTKNSPRDSAVTASTVVLTPFAKDVRGHQLLRLRMGG